MSAPLTQVQQQTALNKIGAQGQCATMFVFLWHSDDAPEASAAHVA
jgi:hypothetical protein